LFLQLLHEIALALELVAQKPLYISRGIGEQRLVYEIDGRRSALNIEQ
jgi:hypothetical protein